MTTTKWKNSAGGDFDTASNWNNGIPQSGDTALITAPGTYTVSSTQANTVRILDMASGARLGIHEFGFDITGGTGTGALAGRIVVNQGTSLGLGTAATATTFDLTGSILIKGSMDFPAYLAVAGDVTLSGQGVIALRGQNSEITGGNATLTNDDTIKSIGQGTIGDPTQALTLENSSEGLIKAASPSGSLAIEVSANSSNAGHIEAVADGKLTIGDSGHSSVITQTAGGEIVAAGGGRIVLDATTITNGLVWVLKNSTLEIADGNSAIGASLKNAGTVHVDSGGVLDVSRAIDNAATGTIVAEGSLIAEAKVIGGSIVISGQGEAELEAAANPNVDFAGSGTLVLDHPGSFTGDISGFAPASQTAFGNFFAFGDSSIDSGWFPTAIANGDTDNEPSTGKAFLIASAVANGGTGAPVGFGLMNSQILAGDFGWTATPADATGGGTNYAIAGATTDEDAGGTVYTNTPQEPGIDVTDPGNGSIGNLNLAHPLPSTVQQIDNYLSANGGHADPSALYLIETGGNDITYAKESITGVPQREAYLIHQADALAAEIETLQAAGAQAIVVHGFAGDNGNPATSFEALFDSELFGDLNADNVNFVESDLSTMQTTIKANPSAFGLTTTDVGTALTGNTASAFIDFDSKNIDSGWGQWGAPTGIFSTDYAFLRTPNAQYTSLYSDDQHFSTQGQQIEADFDLSLLYSAGVAAMDAIDLKTIDYAFGTTTATFVGTTAGGILTVTDGTHTAKLSLSGDYTAANFVTAADGTGGTAVIEAAPSTSAQTDITSSHLLDAHYDGAIVAGMNYAVVDFTLMDSVTLTGDTGGVVLSSADDVVTDGTATTLTNNETIHGGGTIGDGFMTLVNSKTGVVDADNPTSGMTIEAPDHAVNNHGTIEATGGGWLLVSDTTINDSAAAHFSASGTNSLVDLDNATINGGLVSVGAGSFMQTVQGGTSTINASVTDNGALGAFNGSTLLITGTVTGTGAAQVGLGGIMEFASASSDSFTFNTMGTDHTGTLMLDNATSTASQFTGTISGFDVGDDIYLGAISATGATVHAGAFVGGTTTVTVSDGAQQIAITFEGDYHTDPFQIQAINGHVDLLHA